MTCITQFPSITDGEHFFQGKHFLRIINKRTILNTSACTYMYSKCEA